MAEDNVRGKTGMADVARRERLGRITFRAWRRGFREADLVLGPFMEQEGSGLSDTELDMLEALLSEDDYDIYGWIIESQTTPEHHTNPLMERLRAFKNLHVARAVGLGAG